MARDAIVTRFTKVGGGVTAHSHVRLQFRCLGNRSALILKPHQKQTNLFRARSYIATHGVLLVRIAMLKAACRHFLRYREKNFRGALEYSPVGRGLNMAKSVENDIIGIVG